MSMSFRERVEMEIQERLNKSSTPRIEHEKIIKCILDKLSNNEYPASYSRDGFYISVLIEFGGDINITMTDNQFKLPDSVSDKLKFIMKKLNIAAYNFDSILSNITKNYRQGVYCTSSSFIRGRNIYYLSCIINSTGTDIISWTSTKEEETRPSYINKQVYKYMIDIGATEEEASHASMIYRHGVKHMGGISMNVTIRGVKMKLSIKYREASYHIYSYKLTMVSDKIPKKEDVYRYYDDLDILLSDKFKLSHNEIKMVTQIMSKAINEVGDYTTDNFRICMGDINKEEYDEAIDDGCCGFYDETIMLSKDKIITFGFNHGH